MIVTIGVTKVMIKPIKVLKTLRKPLDWLRLKAVPKIVNHMKGTTRVTHKKVVFIIKTTGIPLVLIVMTTKETIIRIH